MDILNTLDTTANFWVLNKQLRVAFNSYYKADKSKGKETSSMAMWAIVLTHHPRSAFANMDLENRKKLAVKEMELGLEGKELKNFFKDREKEIETFKRLCLSRPQRTLDYWQKDLDDRQAFLSTIEYKIETPSDLLDLKEKWMKDTNNHWKSYIQCLKDVQEEEDSSREGSVESISDKGLI